MIVKKNGKPCERLHIFHEVNSLSLNFCLGVGVAYKIITACVADIDRGFDIYSAVLNRAVEHYNINKSDAINVNCNVDSSEWSELFYTLAVCDSGNVIGGLLAETRAYSVGNKVAGIVTWCFVVPEFRGIGLVEKMLIACHDEMDEKDVLLCDVEIRTDDLGLIEYWKRKHGFSENSKMQSFDPEIICKTILK